MSLPRNSLPCWETTLSKQNIALSLLRSLTPPFSSLDPPLGLNGVIGCVYSFHLLVIIRVLDCLTILKPLLCIALHCIADKFNQHGPHKHIATSTQELLSSIGNIDIVGVVIHFLPIAADLLRESFVCKLHKPNSPENLWRQTFFQ